MRKAKKTIIEKANNDRYKMETTKEIPVRL